MQFNFDCTDVLSCDQNGFAILEGSYQNKVMPGYTLFVNEILDTMGTLSSKAQGLDTTITTAQKFFQSNHRIVIKATQDKVLGILKVGVKKLFLRDMYYNYHEVFPLCVLDFYVHESVQRQGIGKQLFDYMLNFEKKTPCELAYDRPSPKLKGFLRKHYNLVNEVKQSNNFIVFNEFFDYLDKSGNSSVYDYNTNRKVNNRAMLSKSTPRLYGNSGYVSDNAQRGVTPALSNVGQSVVYNNNSSFDNKVVNRNVYLHPITGFQTYYLNSPNTVSYDNIYSKKKLNLINDYLQSKNQNQEQFIKQQLDIKEKSIENSNGRLNNLMNKINDTTGNRSDYNIYNKRNQYATIFDDKKLVEYNYLNDISNNVPLNNQDTITEKIFIHSVRSRGGNVSTMKGQENLQHYSPFSQYGKVYTNVLPTTSSAYGAYYQFPQELNARSQSPNRIYY